MGFDKTALIAELRAIVGRDFEEAKRAQKETILAATHPEAKPENDKDTRALELSYLARGQSQRVADLDRAVEILAQMAARAFKDGAPIAIGALVEVESEAGEQTYFIAPAGAGAKLAEGAVVVVTPEAPLGKALVGKLEGDDVELVVAGKKRSVSVVSIR